jgi:hypothetical protein
MRTRKFYDALRRVRNSPLVESISINKQFPLEGTIEICFKRHGVCRFCPLTAAAYCEFGACLSVVSFAKAAQFFDLTYKEATRIAEAADWPCSMEIATDKRNTRKALLRALGLGA